MNNDTRAPAPVSKLGFVEISTRDVNAIVAHYTDVLCFDAVESVDGVAYLTTGDEHHCIAVSAGEPHGRRALGFQLATTLADAEEGLRSAGAKLERRSDPCPGVTDALVLEEPSTGTTLFLYEEMAPSAIRTASAIRPTKLGHVASFVPSIADMQAYYEQTFGFRWSDTIGGFLVFLRCGPDHHTVNFMESSNHSGLLHVAYEARDLVHTRDILDQLTRHKVPLKWGLGRHTAGHNIFTYHQDPDGNFIEIFTELDLIFDEGAGHWEPRPWHEEYPMGPKHWPFVPEAANHWGPPPPAELLG